MSTLVTLHLTYTPEHKNPSFVPVHILINQEQLRVRSNVDLVLVAPLLGSVH